MALTLRNLNIAPFPYSQDRRSTLALKTARLFVTHIRPYNTLTIDNSLLRQQKSAKISTTNSTLTTKKKHFYSFERKHMIASATSPRPPPPRNTTCSVHTYPGMNHGTFSSAATATGLYPTNRATFREIDIQPRYLPS
jgi:hypothetical protein